MSHVYAGRLRVMLVACLGKVKKRDIETHTQPPFPVTPQSLHSSVGFSAPCDWRLCAPHTRCTWLLDGNTLWQDTTDPSAATQRQEERQHDLLQDRSLNAPETLNTQVMLSVLKHTCFAHKTNPIMSVTKTIWNLLPRASTTKGDKILAEANINN